MIRRPWAGEDAERGFTLIELMIVVLIIAMLIAIALPTWTAARERADDASARTLVTSTQVALQVVTSDNIDVNQVTIAKLKDAESTVMYVNGTTNPKAIDKQVSVYVNAGGYAILSTQVHSGGCVAVRTGDALGTLYRRDPTVTACNASALNVATGWAREWPARP